MNLTREENQVEKKRASIYSQPWLLVCTIQSLCFNLRMLRALFNHQSKINNLKFCAIVVFSVSAFAQSLSTDLRDLVAIPAVPGYEQELAAAIAARIPAFKPTVDEMANVVVSVGSGSPHRLIVAPMDEPGYVVRLWEEGSVKLAST